MRRLALPILALLLAACGGQEPPTATSPTTAAPPSPSPSAAVAASVLSWGEGGNSSGVYLQVSQPKPVEEPAPEGSRYVVAEVLAGNKATGPARVSFSGRVGAVEAPPIAEGSPVPPVLPGESVTIKQKFRVPADATELVLEVYANVGQEPTTNRLHFKGPISG
ncbi:hypothetical protein GCM10012275_52600 [Longimycelium tulufanense]|uniref:Uncharacterized protein n=1 Tax=Longimycelium tulufanense TaxID=907463 RepID=A0A8J3CJ83_9PSEU|nr:hypothetical protein [Longimycelium tulufanense]GGM75417.1 hypothetical protein GCM10012275_52600 [Longimycelium tulufanense]